MAGLNSKSSEAFRTIGEVAGELDVPQHVLRFWEAKFPHIRPIKRGGGRRYYRPDDVDLLRSIRQLLHENGYTIKGVQKLLRENGPGALRHAVSVRLVSDDKTVKSETRRPTPAAANGGDRPDILKAASAHPLAAIIEELETLRRKLVAD
jgi:DNA-binding transcriptional MerR regulator